MSTAPIPVDALPALPDSSQAEDTFDATYEAFNVAMKNAFRPQINAIAANVFTNAQIAEIAGAAATLSQAAAAASAVIAVGATNAIMWVANTVYAFGDVRWSPINGLVYRRMVAGAGALDPSGDSGNWTPLSPVVNEVDTPANSTPAQGDVVREKSPTLTASPFYSLYGATHAASQWQLATSADFSAPIYSSGDAAASVSITLAPGVVAVSSTYFWRVRYKNSALTYSLWSNPTSFTTPAAFNSYIATPAATPGAYGDAFEGGFYGGMVWEELVQTATSTAIATGAKTFIVADMTTTPIVYVGQQLEVRSRANPANRMMGTVTGAAGTGLALNVTSVEGAGTFTDWSVMARYRIIVSPKSSESLQVIKNVNSALPAACQTLTEGWRATESMRLADTATVYPAAHYARNLSVGGRADWYVPARDELEVLYRNLKPGAAANNVTSPMRPTAAAFSYANNGSFGDVSSNHGTNNNSFPLGPAYTAATPAQTTATQFTAGYPQAFIYEAFGYMYLTSSEYDATSAWAANTANSGKVHQQENWSKSAGYSYVRPIRRSII